MQQRGSFDASAARRRPSIAVEPPDASENGAHRWALGLGAAWLVVLVLLLVLLPSDEGPSPRGLDAMRIAVLGLAVILPLGLLWLAVTSLRALSGLRSEVAVLRRTVEALERQSAAPVPDDGRDAHQNAILLQLEELSATARRTEVAFAELAAPAPQPPEPPAPPEPEPAPPPAPAVEIQPTFELGGGFDDAPPVLAHSDFIRALNFPETAEDREGFAALRRALRDRQAAQLIQAAEDILTLLSQEGIYMDDLTPDRAQPEIWRHFAEGLRGKQIAPLGGVHDRAALEATSARMKQDPIFRDTAHHFLRLFDKTFAGFAEAASDAEIVALSETRTARAFMILARVAGTFD